MWCPRRWRSCERWGADAIRDCDGTDYPEALNQAWTRRCTATYYTTRKDNAWAKANPDEVQQCYIMTGFHTATAGFAVHPADAGHQPGADGQ